MLIFCALLFLSSSAATQGMVVDLYWMHAQIISDWNGEKMIKLVNRNYEMSQNNIGFVCFF